VSDSRAWSRWCRAPLLAALAGALTASPSFDGEFAVCAPLRGAPPADVVSRCGGRAWWALSAAERLALARARAFRDELDAADALAASLVATRLAADGHQVLANTSWSRGDIASALRHADRAVDLHRGDGAMSELARDLQLRAGLHRERADISRALTDADACVVAAAGARDPLIYGYCELAVAQLLAELGHHDGAVRAVERGLEKLEADRDRAWAFVVRGNLFQEVGANHQAVLDFEAALALPAAGPVAVGDAHINLAYSLAILGELDQAAAHVAQAGTSHAGWLTVTGEIARRRGDLNGGRRYLEQALRNEGHPDAALPIASSLAALEEASGNLSAAESWWRVAVSHVERARGAGALELRPWILASRRAPYEALFRLLVQTHRSSEAIALIDQWLGRTIVDVQALVASLGSDGTYASTARMTGVLAPLWPTLTVVPVTAAPRAVEGRDFVAVLSIGDEVWRAASVKGAAIVDRVDSLAGLETTLGATGRLREDTAAARWLGDRLIPAGAQEPSEVPLTVVIDPKLPWIDMGALRPGGQLLVSRRALVHRTSLGGGRRDGVVRPGAIRVVGDPQGDLVHAMSEARLVAERLGVHAMIGPAATRAAVLDGVADGLLHIATHTAFRDGVPGLWLADGVVTSFDVLVAGKVPRLVVLSVCAASSGDDGEHFGAIASAYLAAGAHWVVATTRSVSDDDARAVMDAFYENGGADQPIEGLQRAQVALAESRPETAWDAFVVFEATCDRACRGTSGI
jgi:tetratricopeptide (TPR) repeat protein